MLYLKLVEANFFRGEPKTNRKIFDPNNLFIQKIHKKMVFNIKVALNTMYLWNSEWFVNSSSYFSNFEVANWGLFVNLLLLQLFPKFHFGKNYYQWTVKMQTLHKFSEHEILNLGNCVTTNTYTTLSTDCQKEKINVLIIYF